MIVRFARQAFADIAEIEAWIAQDNPSAAVKLSNQIYAVCEALSRHPARYPMLPGSAFRKRPIRSYVIIYRLTDIVNIVRVIHSARDWSPLLQS